MNRPTVEVADLLRTHGDRFVRENRSWLSYQQLKVLRAIERCRTPALGGHLDQCSGCDYSARSFNSCRNRHCPKCQAQARQRWLACREQELLGHRSGSLALIRQLLASEPQPQESFVTASCEAKSQCPRCGNSMRISCRLTAREIYSLCERLDTS